jgi:hypothetical protein
MYRANSDRDLRSRPTPTLSLRVLKFRKAVVVSSRWASVAVAVVAAVPVAALGLERQG